MDSKRDELSSFQRTSKNFGRSRSWNAFAFATSRSSLDQTPKEWKYDSIPTIVEKKNFTSETFSDSAFHARSFQWAIHRTFNNGKPYASCSAVRDAQRLVLSAMFKFVPYVTTDVIFPATSDQLDVKLTASFTAWAYPGVALALGSLRPRTRSSGLQA